MAGYLETLTSYYRDIFGPTTAHAEVESPAVPKPVVPKLPDCDKFTPAAERPVVIFKWDTSFDATQKALRAPKGDKYCQENNLTGKLTTPIAVHVQFLGLTTFNPAFTCVEADEIVYMDCVEYLSSSTSE